MRINLLAAWIGILLGFISGSVIGLFFHRDGWLGGYGSLKRRLYRLAHISLFGLGAVNLLFYLTTTTQTHVGGSLLPLASSAFIIGAITMPVCCLIMAHFPKTHLLFAVPVISLIAGALLTIAAIVSSDGTLALNAQPSTLTQP
jgi:hypothetical protein